MVESLEAAETLNLWRPLLWLAGAVLTGLVIELVLLRWVHRWVSQTEWGLDDVIVGALRGMPFFWFTLLGIYIILPGSVLGPFLVGYIDEVIAILVIVSLTIVAYRLVTGLISLYAGTRELPSVSILNNLIRAITLLIGLLVILTYMGVSVTPALAALGVTSLAVSLALQETLSNLFSGVLLVASNQFRAGDYVRLNTGEEGYVVDISWRTTQIRSLANNMIVVPNAAMTSAVATNYYTPGKELSILFDIGVSYDSDLEHVEEVTIDVASEVMREVTGGVPDSEPFIRYNNFDDFAIKFTVIMRGKEFVDQYLIKHEFVKRLHLRYREEGIVIPFPISTLHTPGSEPVKVLNFVERNGQSAQDAAADGDEQSPRPAKGDSGSAAPV